MKKFIVALMFLLAATTGYALEAEYAPQLMVIPIVAGNAASTTYGDVAYNLPIDITVLDAKLTSNTAIASHATDYADFILYAGSTVLASVSTKIGEGGTLSANTPLALTNQATDALHVARNTTIKGRVTKAGSGVATGNCAIVVRYITVK